MFEVSGSIALLGIRDTSIDNYGGPWSGGADSSASGSQVEGSSPNPGALFRNCQSQSHNYLYTIQQYLN